MTVMICAKHHRKLQHKKNTKKKFNKNRNILLSRELKRISNLSEHGSILLVRPFNVTKCCIIRFFYACAYHFCRFIPWLKGPSGRVNCIDGLKVGIMEWGYDFLGLYILRMCNTYVSTLLGTTLPAVMIPLSYHYTIMLSRTDKHLIHAPSDIIANHWH